MATRAQSKKRRGGGRKRRRVRKATPNRNRLWVREHLGVGLEAPSQTTLFHMRFETSADRTIAKRTNTAVSDDHELDASWGQLLEKAAERRFHLVATSGVLSSLACDRPRQGKRAAPATSSPWATPGP